MPRISAALLEPEGEGIAFLPDWDIILLLNARMRGLA
jgi:hypothetical protein